MTSLLVDDLDLSVVDLELVLVVDESHVVGLVVVQVLVQHDVHVLLVRQDDVLEHLEGGLGELHHVLGEPDHLLLLLLGDSLRDSSGDTDEGVGGLSADDGLDVLGLPAGLDDSSSQLESDVADDTEDVPLRRGGGGSAHEVRGSQGVEVRDVAVDEVGVVERVPDEVGGLGRLGVVAAVDGLGRGHVVRAGAHTAEPGGDLVELRDPPADAEPLESPELGDLPVRVLDVSLVIQEDLDLPVSLETGDGVDGDALGGHFLLLIPYDWSSHFSCLLSCSR